MLPERKGTVSRPLVSRFSKAIFRLFALNEPFAHKRSPMATAAPLLVKHQAAGVRPVVARFTSPRSVHQEFGVGKISTIHPHSRHSCACHRNPYL